MYDLITFGEAMIRLTPPSHKRLEQATSLDVYCGGAEYNVAVAFTRLGLKAAWISRLPDNPLGRLCANNASLHHVDTQFIHWIKDERMGLYFTEDGACPRNSTVLYDRAHSAFSNMQQEEFDWSNIFTDTKYFHTSGITPALSEHAAKETLIALKTAKEKGIQTAYDLNYRTKLWSQQKARVTQEPLMEFVDFLFTTEEDTQRIFGIKSKNYQDTAWKLYETYKLKGVCITLRETPTVWNNTWTAIFLMDNTIYQAKRYQVEIVDRIGAGDSLTAGLLFGLIRFQDHQKSLDFAVALSALQQTIPGDVVFFNADEVEKIINQDELRIAR